MKMWMMGYNDGGDTFNFTPDSFNGRKLRPLIPRPLSSLSPNNSSSSSSSSSSIPPFNRLHTNDFFSQFHHMATVTDQSKRELNNAAPVVVSSRWNPTPEQLRVLEELYRRGTRTPSAEQIQHITAQLRRYGKIEGKNVFYWFQNHKARERQKRRRQMESAVAADNSARELEIIGTKDSGLGRTAYEAEQTKNWPSSTNCNTLPQESVPIQRAAKASVMAGDCRTENGWIQFEELHQRRNNNNFAEKNNKNNNNVIANSSSLHIMHSSVPPLATTATAATVTTILHQKSHNNGNFGEEGEGEEISGGEEGEGETLQLFPLCSDDRSGEIIGGKTVENSAMNSTNLTPLQFFEFLPLKN